MQIEVGIVDGESMKPPVEYAKCKTFSTEWRRSKHTVEVTNGSHPGGFKNPLGGWL
jgi:hypothetical protein